ncbi:dynamin family protein [Thiocapsa rosea]|uniref:Dynamin family protein n=1 Tax=Thiocapsa rosea TaxID=69360 RepID=A0A495VB37_9GAMM|nr:dynamin family protein [Thiocapsa rosea]RKT45843.1 dynamin family protein [Thiocapsa rosea]
MPDFETFAHRKQQLQDHYERLIALIAERGVVPEPEADLALLRGARDALTGDLLFRVLCVGDFSTGKSSFINRFLLEQDLLPAWAWPTTTLPTRIRFGAQTRAIRFRPSVQEGADLEAEEVTENIAETLKNWVSTAAKDKVTDRAFPVIVEAPAPRLAAGVEIVDAPGLNDPNPERMKLTLDYLHQADGVLFFINADKPWTKYQKDFFDGELLIRDLLGRLFIIVNYWDCVPASEREEVLDYIRQQVQASLARRGTALTGQPIPILPVSAKTGENAALIQQEVWDVLGARKSTDVLALRVARFNQEVAKYLGLLDDRLALLGLDAQGQSRRRAQLQQEVKDYEQQREVFLAGLSRLLAVEFQSYRVDFQRLFEGLEADVAALQQEALAMRSTKDVNDLLARRISRLQKQAARQMSDLDAAFLTRLKATIEQKKADIRALPSTAVTIEEYVLRWQGLDGNPLAQAAPLAGGVGLAGLLLGAGTFWQTATLTTATPGILASVGTFITGAPAATASSFMLLGVPAIAIGGLLIAAAFFLRQNDQTKLAEQVRAACAQLAERVEDEKWKTLDQLKTNQAQRIAQICADVDDDISRTWRETIAELDAIQHIEDQGAALRALRDALQRLTLRVNP